MKLFALAAILASFAIVGCDTKPAAPVATEKQQTPNNMTGTPGVWKDYVGNLRSGDWTADAAKKSEMDGTMTQFIRAGGNGVNVIMCFENGKPCKVSSYVAVPGRYCTIESNVSDHEWRRGIRVKFDDGAPHKEVWSIADSRDAIFPSSELAFRRELQKHSKMVIELGCASYDNDVQTIPVSGLKPMLDELKIDKKYR